MLEPEASTARVGSIISDSLATREPSVRVTLPIDLKPFIPIEVFVEPQFTEPMVVPDPDILNVADVPVPVVTILVPPKSQSVITKKLLGFVLVRVFPPVEHPAKN